MRNTITSKHIETWINNNYYAIFRYFVQSFVLQSNELCPVLVCGLGCLLICPSVLLIHIFAHDLNV